MRKSRIVSVRSVVLVEWIYTIQIFILLQSMMPENKSIACESSGWVSVEKFSYESQTNFRESQASKSKVGVCSLLMLLLLFVFCITVISYFS